jgi:phospholipase/carboxylesterase
MALHAGQPVLTGGAAIDRAAGAVVMVHGRGATARGMIDLAGALDRPHLAYLAPQAAGSTWYPNRFIAPIDTNEPWLSSALGVVDGLLRDLAGRGVASDRVVVLGFSQGACLVLEYAARHARRYAGIVGLSGGLIGPDGTPRDYAGSLAGTPAFLGCDDDDFHIARERVHETTEVLTRLGARVTERLYRGLGHTVNDDEIRHVQHILDAMGT